MLDNVVMKVAMVMLIVAARVQAAPAGRDLMKGAEPPYGVSSAPTPRHHLRHWLLNTRAASREDGATKTTSRTLTSRTLTSRTPANKQAQMLKMISALEELQRTFNSTLSSRITMLPRANGRNAGRKNKVLPAVEVGAPPTTATMPLGSSTASRVSADAAVPGLTGRSFRKSLPPQAKKTNKRVCFWKYCSQN